MEVQKDLLQDVMVTRKRRALLPWWMKVFIWFFMVACVFTFLAIPFGLTGYQFQLTLYGFVTYEPLSWRGLFIISLFALKGAAAYGLWNEKDWAIKLATIDALVGFAVCIFVTAYTVWFGMGLRFRLEFLFLALYIWQLQRMKHDWKASVMLKTKTDDPLK